MSYPIEIKTQFVPPSLNACYRNATTKDGKQRGRIKTKRYNEWLTAFGWDALGQVPVKDRLKGPYTIKIILCRTARHKLSDIMNREKPVSDALQSLGIIENDNLCESGTVCWADLSPPGGMRIEIWPADNSRIVAAQSSPPQSTHEALVRAEAELPTWDDLRGAAPDSTDGLSSEVFVRKLRGEWR